MELRHLRYFCSVAEWKSFSHAARRLHVSQSSISEQIQDLENEIGVQLFSRSRRQIELTAHGEAFLREAREALAHADRAIDMAQRSARGEIGELSIGFMVAATAPFIPALIREYRQLKPGVRLSLFEMTPVEQMEALAHGRIDLAFTRSLESPFDVSLASECLDKDPIVAVLPESHPLASGPVPVEALAGEQFLLYSREAWPGLFDTVLGICRNAGFSPKVSYSALIQTVLTLVGAGEGVALLPYSVRRYRPRGIAFCRLIPDTARTSLVLAWRSGTQPAVLDSFIELVRARKSTIQQELRETL